MKASSQAVALLVVFASLMMPASSVQCKGKESRQPHQLPVRTYVVDDFPDGLSGFAVYQEVAPDFWLQRQRKPPPSVQLCKYDRLGSHAWPPTAVCWITPTALQQQLQSSPQTAADAAAAAAKLDSATFNSQASTEVGTEVRPGFYGLAVLEGGRPGQKDHSQNLKPFQHSLDQTGEPVYLLSCHGIAACSVLSLLNPQDSKSIDTEDF